MHYIKVTAQEALQDANWQLTGSTSHNKDMQISVCIQLIRKHFQRKMKVRNYYRSSYGLKHDFEKIGGIYISNGAAIKAMVLCGFTPYQNQTLICGSTKEKPIHNYDFNFSFREWRLMLEQYGKQIEMDVI